MNPWMTTSDPHELKGMAGQLLNIHGRGFAPVIERTDDNFYKDSWGWFNQRDLIQPYIGDKPCRVDFANDTFINCTIFWQPPGRVDPIRVKTYGKGWSNSSFSMQVHLDIFDISPSIGSVAGGTEVTVTGTGFLPYENMDGFLQTDIEYAVYFGLDEQYHFGIPNKAKTPVPWTNGWNRGYPCIVNTVTYYQLICTMADMSSIPSWNGLGFPVEGIADHVNKTQFLDFEVSERSERAW